MKVLRLLMLALLILAIGTAFKGKSEPEYVEGEVLLRLKGVSAQGAAQFLAQNDLRLLRRFEPIDVLLLKLPAGEKVSDALKRLQTLDLPNYIYRTALRPNDPYYDRLWGMENIGQTGGLADADIDASAAWDTVTGSDEVIVGIVDTGVDFKHPDLAANIHTNPGEDPWADPNDPTTGNGIDDDGNGKIDDWKGWNFINNTNNPFDDNMHGTHCAGIVGAVGNNGIGVVGVCWNVRLLPLKFLDSRGSGSTSQAIDAIIYGADMGARVLNASWGGGGYSTALENAVRYAAQKGVLFVAAAGNDGTDNDVIPFYPANYEVANVLSVAASDHGDNLALWGGGGGGSDDDCGLVCGNILAAVPGSNYGKKSVHLAAPGKDILSTVPGNSYSALSGTSMAAPHVSGAAALLIALQPDLTVANLRTLLVTTVDPLESLNGRAASGGRLNAAAAVAAVPRP